MKTLQASLFLLVLTAACKTAAPDFSKPLPPGAPALLPLAPGESHPDFGWQWNARADIMPALENSLAWTKKESSKKFFPIEGVSQPRALKSLELFKSALMESKSADEFAQKLDAQFTVLKSAGWNGRGGGVLFTGYCTPILEGSLSPDATHRYPLYALPPDVVKGPEGEILGQRMSSGSIEPYPTRRAIEASSMLAGKGLELAWLSDPIDAYIAHVNGSAFIRLADGQMLELGYSGKNGRKYVSLGQELVKDKQLEKNKVNLASIRTWAKAHPAAVDDYLARNESYVFFTKISGNPHGSLNVPVIGGRSLATDKTLFPRGAIVYIDTQMHAQANSGARLQQFVFDQDTGGAIRTAGRADVYLGVGDDAEKLAGATRAEGQMYYLFAKE